MRYTLKCILIGLVLLLSSCTNPSTSFRERISFNEGWKFMKYDSAGVADNLIYDERPEVKDTRDYRPADEKPTEAEELESKQEVLKPWILPTGNAFIKDETKRYQRPDGNPGSDFPFVQSDFDDGEWESVDLPHDWAIAGPFYEGWGAEVSGGMGRLPSPGVAWYRNKIEIPAEDKDKSIFLEVDGAMSYAMVWVNGQLAGGWPYGYSSWRIDMTPYLKFGGSNQIAIRLDNPNNSSRWYPGGGIYRNVWITKTHPVHVSQWGTFVTTEEVSSESAKVNLEVSIDNELAEEQSVKVKTEVYEINTNGEKGAEIVAAFEDQEVTISGKDVRKVKSSVTIENPKLWGPPPTQQPNLYVAVTKLSLGGKVVDEYETSFGIRDLIFDANEGVFVNGEKIFLKGVNQHHDLGALGAAFNLRAAERQLELLQEMGCNAIRIAHNPPAPELLDLTDKMGFLVVDELYDSWERKKTPLDFHLIFPEWHEQDLRSLIRRDKKNPSVILWSTGNEVGEQYTGEDGAEVVKSLKEIANDEDPTRMTSASQNFAKADMPFTREVEVINLNYQGEGIRDAPAYEHLREGRISAPPSYPTFHKKYPGKVIISSENAAAMSSRGTYIFPVADGISSPMKDKEGNEIGGNPEKAWVSSYEMYTADFGASADKVFRSLDQHPYVAGGFVWSGWDYLGEPTPYYQARSSYFGIIDLAGFKKDRFYLYQSRWRPDFPMVHILPHWNWPDRVGEVTPIHVFTSGDEVELFLNGESLGRKIKSEFEYRLRWDDVVYKSGEVKAIAYKDGEKWAEEIIRTTGEAAGLKAYADRSEIAADGKDLSFITVDVVDQDGLFAANANNEINFSIDGPGEIIATDNGDPMDFTPFPSKSRNAFGGKVLVIVKGMKGKAGKITVIASGEGLQSATVELVTK